MGDSLKCPVIVIGNSLHYIKLCSGDTADGSVPAISNPHVQVSGVEIFKVLIQRYKILQEKEFQFISRRLLSPCHCSEPKEILMSNNHVHNLKYFTLVVILLTKPSPFDKVDFLFN